jgi:hypothetical protein
MPRVRCPDCERLVKVPDEDLAAVRCPCGRKLRLDEADEAPRPQQRRPSSRKSRRRVRGLVPLLVLGPVGLLLVPLAPFFLAAALTATFGGLALFITGIVMVYRIFKEKGRGADLEMGVGGTTGGWMLLFTQIGYAIRYPRPLGAWVGLQLLGLVLLVEGGFWQERLAWPPPQQQQTSDEEVVAQVSAALDDNNPFARQNAALRLSRLSPNQRRAEVAARLAGLLADREEIVRSAALQALKNWAGPDEVPALLKALDDNNPFLRNDALDVLARFKEQRMAAPVARCLDNLTTQERAGKVLRGLGPMAEKDVLAYAQLQDPLTAKPAILVLKGIGTAASLPTLQAVAGAARDAMQTIRGRTGNPGAK